MAKELKAYTLKELCNEHEEIIIDTQEGIRIGLEKTPEGTLLYLYFGNEVVEKGFHTLIKPKS